MRKKLNLSLRQVLLVTFVAEILVSVSLTSYFSWRNGQKTIEALAMRLGKEVTSHTQQHIDNYLSTPALFLQINRLFTDSGKIDLEDRQELQRIFWQQTQIDPHIDTIFFGSETGDFLEVENKELAKVSIRDRNTAPYWETYTLDSSGRKTERINRQEYDPRQRPWYQAAIEQQELVWSPVYMFTDPPVLGITSAMPIINPQTQQPEGVMAIDITLSDISSFLSSLKVGDSGRVFILEQSGKVVATSADDSLIVETAAGKQPLNYKDSEDSLVRNTAQFIIDRFGNLDSIDEAQQSIVRINGDRYFLQTENLDNGANLNWLIVTTIPESDFTEHIRSNIYTTLILNAIAAVSAGCLGVTTGKWIVRPIANLSAFAKALSNGKITQIGDASSIKELAEVADSFNSIASNLQSVESRYQENAAKTQQLQKANQKLDSLARLDGLTQVANRYHFDTVLKQIWQQKPEQPVSLILCDVDHFKLYNDTYGHPAGDGCLQKVAQAISSTVRRKKDLVARYGGEEFAVILPNTELTAAVKIAENIRRAIAHCQIPHSSSQKNYVTASFGVATTTPQLSQQVDILLQQADKALYQAKERGRNCVVVMK